MCQWGAHRNPLTSYRMGLSPSHVPLNAPNVGRKSPLFRVSAEQLETKQNCQHSTLENTLDGCKVMPRTTGQVSPKPQMSERRSSTIWLVVEWSLWWWPGYILYQTQSIKILDINQRDWRYKYFLKTRSSSVETLVHALLIANKCCHFG